MSKFFLSVIAALAITFTSIAAITANQNVPNLDDQYVRIGTCFTPYAIAMESGDCLPNGEDTCIYTKVNPEGSDCDPLNFESNQDGGEYVPY